MSNILPPQHPHMIAAGLYDGSVVVYNLQSGGSEPVCQATADTGKHRDVVWSVRWTRDDLESYLNFFSVSEVREVQHHGSNQRMISGQQSDPLDAGEVQPGVRRQQDHQIQQAARHQQNTTGKTRR